MGVVLLIVAGAILGWLAAILLQIEEVQGVTRNVAVGIVGALMAGLIFNPLIGGGNMLAGNYEPDGLIVAALGSVLLLLTVNLLRHQNAR